MKKFLVIILGIILLLLAGYGYVKKSSSPSDISIPTTLKGEYLCLPHKDTSGPQTMECAYGMKANDGFNYALSMDQSLMLQFQSGKSVTVEGELVPVEALSSDHWQKYDIKGIVQVRSVQ